MPVVEKTSGPNVTVRGIGEFEIGDREEVDGSDAEYLVEERGDFELVDGSDDFDVADDTACSRCGQSHDDGACWDLIEAGVCPWCDDYEGDGVAQHASSAHPDEWDEYKED